MATVPEIRTRLLEGFSEKQADLLARVVFESRDDLATRGDFIALTGVVKDLADAQKRTELNVEGLAEAQRRTETRVEELAETLNRTERQLEKLTEAQSVTEGTLADVVRTQNRMLIRLDRLDGRSLELTLARHLPAYVGRVFRKCRIIEPLEFVDSLEDRLSEAELEDLLRTDIIATARLGERPVHLVVEVSCTADADDVARVMRRSAILSRAGIPAIGIVACEGIPPPTLAAARADGVRVLVDGRLLPEAA